VDDTAAYLLDLATTGTPDEDARARLALMRAALLVDQGAPPAAVVWDLVQARLCEPYRSRVDEVFAELANGMVVKAPDYSERQGGRDLTVTWTSPRGSAGGR